MRLPHASWDQLRDVIAGVALAVWIIGPACFCLALVMMNPAGQVRRVSPVAIVLLGSVATALSGFHNHSACVRDESQLSADVRLCIS